MPKNIFDGNLPSKSGDDETFKINNTNSHENENFNENVLLSINEQLINYLKIIKQRNPPVDEKFSANKVIDFKSPDELKNIFNFEIAENEKPLNDDKFLELTEKIIKYSVNTGHHNSYNTLFGRNDEYALSGDFLTSSFKWNYVFL